MADFIDKASTSALNKLIIRLIVNDKIINLQNIKTVDQEGPLKANVPGQRRLLRILPKCDNVPRAVNPEKWGK